MFHFTNADMIYRTVIYRFMKQDTNGVNEVGIAEVCTTNVNVSINIMYFLTTEALDKRWS